ncbi:MAG: B12-binding domain-containing radical SAM protein [Gemmatimonadales bacterium]|jgi:anaerobic magnesium-protoporphyrin IX monomethyl ester cyclase
MILLAHSYFLGNDPKQLERMKPYPPLATLLVAEVTRRHGHEVAFFDATFADGVDAFIATLDEVRPSVVGILEDNFNFLTKMCTIRAREATLAMVSAAADRGCRIAVNGSDASDHPGLYLAAGADAVITGEPELTFVALADAWAHDSSASLADIAGLILTDGPCDLKYTPRRHGIRDLDSLPLPAWDLIDADAYASAWRAMHGRFSWNVVTSRGCPFGCNWCAKPIFGRRYAQRSPASVAEELRQLKDTINPDHVWFADDIFGLTAGWVLDFAREVRIRDARIPFMMQSRANLMTPVVVSALAAAGAEEVWMGVESGSQRILNAMDKGTTVDEVRVATRALKAHGIRACWFIQLGYPSEMWEDVEMTRNVIRDERPDDIGVSVAYPLPGTKFHDSVRKGLGIQQNWEHTGELAMLFQGTYTTAFYRQLRDALHDQGRSRSAQDAVSMDATWDRLAHTEALYRSPRPLVAPSS